MMPTLPRASNVLARRLLHREAIMTTITLGATHTSMSTAMTPSIGTTTRPFITVGAIVPIGAHTGAGTGIGVILTTIAIGAGIPIGPTDGAITITTGITRIPIGTGTMMEDIMVEDIIMVDTTTA